jgi:hypothetical protein
MICSLIGGMLSSIIFDVPYAVAQSSQNISANQISARSFNLTDSKGTTKGKFYFSSGDESTTKLWLGSGGKSGISLGIGLDQNPYIIFNDSDGKRSRNILKGISGSKLKGTDDITVNSVNAQSFNLFDSKGTKRGGFTVNSDNRVLLWLGDHPGEANLTVDIEPYKDPAIYYWDRNHHYYDNILNGVSGSRLSGLPPIPPVTDMKADNLDYLMEQVDIIRFRLDTVIARLNIITQ